MLKKIIALTNKNNTPLITDYIKNNIALILDNKDAYVTCKKFAKGDCGAFLLTMHNFNNVNVVLKKIPYLDLNTDQKVAQNVKYLADKYQNSVKILAENIKHNGDIYVIWEYAEPMREPNLNDLKNMTLKRWDEAGENIVEIDQNIQLKYSFLNMLKQHGSLFSDPEIKKILNPEMLNNYRQWTNFFLSNNFLHKYNQLPKSFIHADIKLDNIIIQKDGPKLIDWDDSRVETRLYEITRLIMSNAMKKIKNMNTEKDTYIDTPEQFLASYKELKTKIQQSQNRITKIEAALFDQILFLDRIVEDSWRINEYKEGRLSKDELESCLNTLWESYKYLMR
ncbi:MAG: phosphotransferase [Candidatus Margulisiibacteriota bacterium]|jgi:serine/threonine protein kinase